MDVSSSYLAQVLGVSVRRVQQLAEQQIIEKNAKTGKYNLSNCVQRYFEYKFDNNNVEYLKEHALLEKAKRQKAELQLARMKGELHESSVIEDVMTDMLVRFRNKVLALPAQLAPLLVNQTDLTIIESILRAGIEECLTELADYSPDLFMGEDYFVDSDTDYEEDEDEEEDEEDESNEEE